METIAAIGLKLDQDDRHTHIWKKTTLCPVTVLVDSQVSDCCPWATCFFFQRKYKIMSYILDQIIVLLCSVTNINSCDVIFQKF